MAINFPSSPTDGQVHTDGGGLSFQYNSSAGAWYALTVASPFNGSNGANGVAGANGFSPPISITIEYPTATERIPLLMVDRALTINRIESVLQGSGTPNVVFTLRYDTSLANAGTLVNTSNIICTNTTFGLETTSFTNPNIPVNNWVWLTTASVSGTYVNSLTVTVMTTPT